jgi:hypothetical protein
MLMEIVHGMLDHLCGGLMCCPSAPLLTWGDVVPGHQEELHWH